MSRIAISPPYKLMIISTSPLARRRDSLGLRLEAPEDIQADRAELGWHGLGCGAITAIRGATAGRVALLIAKVIAELDLQTAREDRFSQRGQTPLVS
jgi:hypothetical protein